MWTAPLGTAFGIQRSLYVFALIVVWQPGVFAALAGGMRILLPIASPPDSVPASSQRAACSRKGKTMAHPRFKIAASSGGQFTFNLTAANGEIILASERYASHDGAKRGVVAVQANATIDERYVRKDSTNGQYYFVLRAGNNEIIGTSEMYKTPAARDGGIGSVKANAPLAATEG
jgi:uncharacterized protein YegP (UPF0339 family)